MKYTVHYTTDFKRQHKKLKKQNKDLTKLYTVIATLANDKPLEEKYHNHKLKDDKYYKNCYECHIEPDWLLIYKIDNNTMILLLFATGNHRELFKNY